MKASQWIGLVPAALILVATASGPVSARVRDTASQVYDTDESPRLSLRNVNGDLRVEAWDKHRIEVAAVKSAVDQEGLDSVEIRYRMDNGRLRIDAKYKDDHQTIDGRNMPSVDFTIRVPRGTRIDEVELVNGSIDIEGVTGDVEASSVNGAVSGKRIGGDVALSAVNGTVSLVAGNDVDSIRLNTVNGGVVLTLPRKFDARITAGTLHGGSVSIDGLDVDATSFTGSSMKGTIGKGGMKVDLNTVNGSIKIRREGESGSREEE